MAATFSTSSFKGSLSRFDGYHEDFLQIETHSGSVGGCNKEVFHAKALEVGHVGKQLGVCFSSHEQDILHHIEVLEAKATNGQFHEHRTLP